MGESGGGGRKGKESGGAKSARGAKVNMPRDGDISCTLNFLYREPEGSYHHTQWTAVILDKV